ncbi:MAG TPA: Ig-like domain-containing protein [Pseudonocardiaceae bacterium]|nr:Ig-like domain-containing protein [Pseudonocardiaceae bacterium]
MGRWPGVVAILIAALGLVLAGCSPQTAGTGGTGAGAGSTPAVPDAKLTITPATGSQNVGTDTPITVAATGGRIHDVTVRTAGDPVAGALTPDGMTWQSTDTLNTAQSYTVTATGANSAGRTVSVTSTFTTLTPPSVFHTHIFEGAGDTYGVGMPIELTFTKHITNEAAVEQALHITTSQPVVGAWSWIDDEHVDFRPRDYWPAHTQVSFTGLLNGVQGAPGVYGAGDLTQNFSIGDSLIVVAGAASHRMQVYDNGQLQYDWPISTGKPGHDTANGTYLTIDKANPQEMKPSDIAPGQPGYYDLEVPWSVRFTWSGDFLHDAYWSVGEQGDTNVSHGCVNMPPADAQIYYQEELPGDPVTITGSPLAGTVGDGWTDWFQTWPQLLAGSATHQAVQAGPNGSTFVPPTTLTSSAAAAPLTTSPSNNAAAS